MSGYLMDISDQEFKLMRNLIYQRFGINLTDQKKSLMVGRLQKIIRATGYNSFQEYYEHLIADSSEKALGELIDRISTNHTFFNREKEHFRFFVETALPAIVSRLERDNRRDLRIWCAGCSSGEEPYMLLMLLHEFFGQNYGKWDSGILATDISQRALSIARAASYPQERIADVPEALRKKYFRRQPDGSFAVIDQIKNEATFRRFNLMNERFPFKKPFHIIFCRNVMIYFDQTTRETLVGKFHQFTEPGGYLCIGHSETIGRSQSLYKYLMPATYQRESDI
ncbi:MAG: chemotaxis protein CheR [Desulfuromonadaceae bacterium GWC2_58_13]|nr:MAG: chemotaxis protein CheR [Desulfuromonadaceae bacterium GWC2_58_13]